MHRVGLCVASTEPSPGVTPGEGGSYRNTDDPGRDTKCPDRQEFDVLRPEFVRSLVLNFDYFGALLDRCPPDVKVIACVNQQTLNPADGLAIGLEPLPAPDPSYKQEKRYNLARWTATVEALVATYGARLYAIEITNEWDVHVEYPEHSGQFVQAFPATEVVRLIRAVQAAIHVRSIRIITGGTVTGPDAVIELMDAILADAQTHPTEPLIVDGVGVHPYVSSAGGIPPNPDFQLIVAKVSAAYEQTKRVVPDVGYPIYVTEFGISPAGAMSGGDPEPPPPTYPPPDPDTQPDEYDQWQARFQLWDAWRASAELKQALFLQAAFKELTALDESILAVACWFAWSDAVGMPGEAVTNGYGLRKEVTDLGSTDRDQRLGRRADAWCVYASLAARPPKIWLMHESQLYLYDYGSGWLDRREDMPGRLDVVWAEDENRIAALDSGFGGIALVRSTDGGRTYEQIPASGLPEGVDLWQARHRPGRWYTLVAPWAAVTDSWGVWQSTDAINWSRIGTTAPTELAGLEGALQETRGYVAAGNTIYFWRLAGAYPNPVALGVFDANGQQLSTPGALPANAETPTGYGAVNAPVALLLVRSSENQPYHLWRLDPSGCTDVTPSFFSSMAPPPFQPWLEVVSPDGIQWKLIYWSGDDEASPAILAGSQDGGNNWSLELQGLGYGARIAFEPSAQNTWYAELLMEAGDQMHWKGGDNEPWRELCFTRGRFWHAIVPFGVGGDSRSQPPPPPNGE